MSQIRSVYIVEPIDQGWIIERLMREVAGELNSLGLTARIGPSNGYRGEEVIFNARYLTALSDPRARVNSLFITHIDDKTKEIQLKGSFERFNSFVCMSPHDAEFVGALAGGSRGVIGIDLPARDLKVRPIRLVMFSARYEDGRKNEQWLVEYFRDKPAGDKAAFVLCFMGWGWEDFCAELGRLEMSYEIYRYSRFAPGEYERYKEVLATMDTLIYLGFDGGAMSVYDALGAGIEAIVPNVSYHRGLGPSVAVFDDKSGFFTRLDRLADEYEARTRALDARSIGAYAQTLLTHWNAIAATDATQEDAASSRVEPDERAQVLRAARSRYMRLTPGRIRSALIRFAQAKLLK